ncbi:peptidoglycan DD-metalloendopeptidase family protein [Nonomuraea sp. M3C6]|uniref:Peptidoglycan DD-metalloendopeptidase family protein n=1 Tax=Nonomuraea marmarensis TaxID=3351344 RepID=A0ABW7AK10_9ACTN
MNFHRSPHPKRPTSSPPNRRTPHMARRALTALLVVAVTLAIPAPPARASPPAWRWPLDGHPRILRRFTPPPKPWLAGHRGLDLAAPTATPVLAAGPGTVRFAGPVAGKGVVTIEHPDGLRTTYLPVTASVRRGQPVTPGAKLGVIEATKDHCQESCLHWGLLRETLYLDPLLLLTQAPIRLLPYWLATPTNPATPITGSPSNTAPTPSTASDLSTGASPTSDPPFNTTPPLNTDSPPSTGTPLSTTPGLRTASTLSANRSPAQPTPQFLTLSAATPAAPAIGLGTLLATVLLITALRRRRRSRTNGHSPRRGQHRKRRHRGRARKRRPPISPPSR